MRRLGGPVTVRRVAAAAGVLVCVVGFAMLVRPLFHVLSAETVTADIGIRAAPTARARAVDDLVLRSIESRTFSRELRHRLDRPARRVTLDAFRIDRCEVRQIEFERFAKWQQSPSASPPPHAVPADALVSSSTGHRIAGLLQSPATGVTFTGAARYCAVVGGRLPWAEELEAAATGAEGRLYPWGDVFDPGAWPYHDSWHNAARTCGSHSPSDTPNGIHDLNSNAMEWSAGSLAVTPDIRQPTAHGAPAPRTRARALYALNAAWLTIAPSTRSHHLGFRCVYDSPPPPKRPWGDAAGPHVPIEAGEYSIGLPADVRLARLAIILPDRQRDALRARLADAHQSQTITVGRCEVSRRDYHAFLSDLSTTAGLFANPQEPAHATYTPLDWARQLEEPDRPVAGITWWAADAFARWAGGRLLQAWEWQQLAAGLQARRYPWGDEYLAAAAVTADRRSDDGKASPGPLPCADAGRHDVSVAGVRHLAGNVSEWTQSITVDRGAYAMWVQGGNWMLPGRETARSTFGRLVPLNHRSADIGLRVVYE